MYAYSYIHIHKYTYVHMHTHTYAHIYLYILTYMRWYSSIFLNIRIDKFYNIITPSIQDFDNDQNYGRHLSCIGLCQLRKNII